MLTRKAVEKAAEKATKKETGGKATKKETGGNTEVDLGEGNVKVKTKGGETELQTGDNLPKDFPKEFPLYPGAEIKGSLRTESKGKVHFQVTLETSDEFSKVTAFFKEKLPESGYIISSSAETPEGALFYLRKDEEAIGMVMLNKETNKTIFRVTITK